MAPRLSSSSPRKTTGSLIFSAKPWNVKDVLMVFPFPEQVSSLASPPAAGLQGTAHGFPPDLVSYLRAMHRASLAGRHSLFLVRAGPSLTCPGFSRPSSIPALTEATPASKAVSPWTERVGTNAFTPNPCLPVSTISFLVRRLLITNPIYFSCHMSLPHPHPALSSGLSHVQERKGHIPCPV